MDTHLSTITTGELWFFYGFLAALLVLAGCIVWMLVSLARQGDERRRYILSQTCTKTFLVWVAVLLIDVAYALIFGNRADFTIQSHPLLDLGVIALLFTVILFWQKRRYGN